MNHPTAMRVSVDETWPGQLAAGERRPGVTNEPSHRPAVEIAQHAFDTMSAVRSTLTPSPLLSPFSARPIGPTGETIFRLTRRASWVASSLCGPVRRSKHPGSFGKLRSKRTAHNARIADGDAPRRLPPSPR